LVATVVLVVSALPNDVLSPVYKCGSECDQHPMDSNAPDADSMPHVFGAHVPTTGDALSNAMNALPALASSGAVVDDSAVMSPSQAKVVNDLIPYKSVPETPALRRPCNLNQVLDLLQSVKRDLNAEGEHDQQLHDATRYTLPLSSAQEELKVARDRVTNLRLAKKASEELKAAGETLDVKSALLQQLMNEKADLVKEEGMIKAPIVKAIGRTNLNLKNAQNAKQAAVAEFTLHPGFTKAETQELVATYDELISSMKHQLASLHEEANQVLTPLQLNINQTQHKIERVDAEITALRSQLQLLLPVAQTYTPQGLEMTLAIEADVGAHFGALSQAHTIDLHSYDQRAADRQQMIKVVDDLIMIVSDIQQPQDSKDVEIHAAVQSLAGALAAQPIYHAAQE
jgi:hypothetical protein